jgi:two-component system NtrC family sensor kinase
MEALLPNNETTRETTRFYPGRTGTEEARRESDESFRFLAEMAHEVSNPVQGILGMAELILDEQDPATIREYTLDIVNFSKHIAEIVHDFAGYARSSIREKEAALDLRERLTEAIKMVRRCPHFGQVEVVTQFQPMPPLLARRVEIDQVFVNLISNAVQAMKGSGRLVLATQNGGDTMVVRISDTGCGIPEALIHKIFDPFFTTKDPEKGTGLGLSVTRHIVAKYGGTIGVQSEEGKGTTFTIQFPTANRMKEVHDGEADDCCGGRAAGACFGGE